MRAMAIIALDQALVDTVMKWSSELGADILVAGVAKLRRFRLHKELAFLGVVGGVAVGATDAVSQMHGVVVIAVLLGVLVAV